MTSWFKSCLLTSFGTLDNAVIPFVLQFHHGVKKDNENILSCRLIVTIKCVVHVKFLAQYLEYCEFATNVSRSVSQLLPH